MEEEQNSQAVLGDTGVTSPPGDPGFGAPAASTPGAPGFGATAASPPGDPGFGTTTTAPSGDPGDILGALLSDKQLIERVSQIVALAGGSGGLGSVAGGSEVSADSAANSIAAGAAGLFTGNASATSPGSTQSTAVNASAASPGSTQNAAANTAADPPPSAQSGIFSPERLSALSSLLSDNELLRRLPGVLSMLSPGADKSVPTGAKGQGAVRHSAECDHRIALLSALKPYMDPRRCEAIDYLIRINRIGDIINRLR